MKRTPIRLTAIGLVLTALVGGAKGPGIAEVVHVPDKARLLVIAPHCDDETLAAAGLIHEVLGRAGEARIVLMTNGDGYPRGARNHYRKIGLKSADYIRFGELRREESIAALTSLGVPREGILSLGYPDGGLAMLWSKFWTADNPYLSPYTDLDRAAYPHAYRQNAPYTGEEVIKDLTAIITAFDPTVLVFPHPHDRHPDHWATHAFVKSVLEALEIVGLQEELYLIHRGWWPKPFGDHPNEALDPAASVVGKGTIWRQLPLSPDAAAAKRAALLCYQSQLRVMRIFLMAFNRTNELFGEYPSVDLDLLDAPWSMPLTISEEPTADRVREQFKPAGDLKSVSAYVADEERLSISLTVKNSVSRNYLYGLDLTIFPAVSRNTDFENTLPSCDFGHHAGGGTTVAGHIKGFRHPG